VNAISIANNFVEGAPMFQEADVVALLEVPPCSRKLMCLVPTSAPITNEEVPWFMRWRPNRIESSLLCVCLVSKKL